MRQKLLNYEGKFFRAILFKKFTLSRREYEKDVH